ncbi:MAG: hypothetical protein JRH20_30485 [Deltaproteobacteria bacterium]|nr:hypothetical protein [Deltaproteobacteria bacterium]
MNHRLLLLPGGLLLGGLVLLAPGCGATTSDYVPTELKERVPSLGVLGAAIPGRSSSVEESASQVVHADVAELRASLAPLSVLGGFFDEGADRDRDVSLFVALESPPHVADQVVRYIRGSAQLDVERVGDHAFFYLQYDRGDGFAPEDAMDASRMLVDGGTVVPEIYGTRPARQATGIHDPTVGFMRLHFNHRPGDEDAVNRAVQLDYNTEYSSKAGGDVTFNYRHFSFFRRDDVGAADGQLVAMLIAANDTSGWVLRSERRGSGVAFSWIAAFSADGSLSVWHNDGSLWACYDSGGRELGNADNPIPCAELDLSVGAPPGGTGLWRSLPSLQ